MYPQISYTHSSEFYNDINNRKEFAYLTNSRKTPGTAFEPTSNQIFCRNYVNPWTPYTRVLNKSGTGLGKTFTALFVAKPFIDEGRNIIVIGFQQERFIEEIITRPELGFVTKLEVQELLRLQRLSLTGNADHVKAYRDYKSKLKRRNKSITFYGYSEFTNRIFDTDRLENPRVNYDLIESLRFGLIICDEIHNAYNSIEQNTWGKTIQFVINILGPEVYLLLLSATPITNSNEISDFLNLLADSPGINIKKLKYGHKDDQKIIINEIIDFSYPKLTDLKLPENLSDEDVDRRTKGKVIFVPDIGIESIPKRITYGEQIAGIKYLKFIRVQMSEIQESETMKHFHNHHLRDIGGLMDGKDYSDEVNEIEQLLQDTEQSNKIRIFPIKTSDGIYLSGEGLNISRLERYSPKFCKMLDLIFTAVKGKILIYHHNVHNAGVLTIQEVLRENGILSENDTPSDYSRCTHCSKIRSEHNKDNLDHDFAPMRFISIHSKLDKVTTDKNKTKFNSMTNIDGTEFRILLGSRKIKEGMDFKAVKTQIILGLPTNMSTLLQVFGRTARTMSHYGLPKEEWLVHTYLLICQFKNKFNNPDSSFREENSSPEEIDYKNKVDDYLKIQKYDLIFNKNAIDLHVMNTPSKLAFDSELGLKALPYEVPKLNIGPEYKNTTYFALERYKEEIVTIKYLIYDAFKVKNVWQIYKLWDYIKSKEATPNPSYFDIRNYTITLKSMPKLTLIGEYVIQSEKEIESFVRKPTSFNEVKLMKVNTIKESQLRDNITKRIELAKKINAVNLYDVYETYMIDMHIRLLENAIETNSEVVLQFYGCFFKLLSAEDVKITGVQDTLGKVIGYVYNDNNKYLTKSGWKSYPYVESTPENNIIIGMYSQEMHFKLREPLEILKAKDKDIDMRKVQRGANCFTRTKDYLLKVMKRLGIDVENERIYDICDTIKKELIRRESIKMNGTKWMYFN